MDWGGNNGSMQSSNTGGDGGGNEAEYDSFSHAFFHVGGVGGVSGGGGGNYIQQAPSLQHSSLFDPLSNFLITDPHNNLFSPPLSLSSSSRSDQNPSSTLNVDILLQNPSATIPRTQLSNFNSLMTSSLQQSSLFDPLSNFLITDHHNNLYSPPLSLSSSSRSNQNPSSSRSNQNPSSSLNLDILLQNPSATIPETQLSNFNSLITSSISSPSHQEQSVLPHSGRVASENPSSFPTNNSTDHQHQANISNQQPNQKSKKRRRASRRAPKTVLRTDTSNFRAMVQEFTGMPTQPVPSSSSLLFPRNTRPDLFSNTTSTVRSGGCGDSSYLLPPFAQKPHQIPPFLSSSTSSMMLNSNATASTSTTNTNPSMTSSSIANNFQLLSDQLGFPPYQSVFLRPNPINQSNDVTSDGLISTMPMRNNSSSWENRNYNNSQRHLQQQQMVTGNAEKGSTGNRNSLKLNKIAHYMSNIYNS